ncbi:MAG TPA: mycofactocin biosynthesis peptidyl-dipeptidase MftE [Acidimicrobiales bacterium]|nr:mycofactocin biosynthesis peptidyl-dipeptidase MftE [Acidimicrobiales bacterium]
MSRLLSGCTSPDAAELAATGAVLVVPIGSTEQHGPHLPLSQDTDLAVSLCGRLAEVRSDVVVAPAIPYGASGEHEGFAGTLSIGCEALEHVVVELCRSASATFGSIVLVSAHGGNAEPVHRARIRLEGEGRRTLVWSPRWEGDAHAGRVETSLALAIHPQRVDLSRAEAGNRSPLAELLPVLREGSVRAVSANGVLGDPTGASAAEGRHLLDRLALDLCTTVARWMEGNEEERG